MRKRISFFTNMYFILISVSMVVLIYKFDSSNSRRDMNYILECNKFNKIELNDIKNNGTIEDKIYTWINVSNRKLWERNKKARESLVSILVDEYGAPRDEINRIKGYSNNDDNYSSNKHNFNLIGVDTAYINDLNDFYYQKGDYATVNECLLKIKLLSKHFNAVILKAIEKNDLRNSIDSIFVKQPVNIEDTNEIDSLLNKRRLRVFDRIRKVKSVDFREGKFFINCRSGSINAQHGGTKVPSIYIHGATEKLVIPSFSALLNYNSENIDDLLNNQKLFNRLQNTYGNLYIDDCIQLLSEENSKSYKSILIFGFLFSRQNLHFIFLFFCVLASIGLYLTLFKAKQRGIMTISEAHEEEALFMLVEYKYSRFFIWCLSPIIIVLMNFDFETNSLTAILFTTFVLISIFLVNFKSYLLSLKL